MTERRTAVITGSTKGLGRAMALRLARSGWRVVIHGNDALRADAVRAECGEEALVFLGDIARKDVNDALARFAVEQTGRLDAWVSNAGVVKMEPFLEFSAETWQRLVEVHLNGAFYGGQAAAREMAKRGWGRIVHVSTIAASFGQFGFAAYAAVKAGVEALSRVMAVELASHGITVNTVAPGPVWNEMLEGLYGAERLRERERTIPLQRMAQAEEVAAAVEWLLSDNAAYITGQILRVDGGASAAGPFTLEVYKRSQRP
ncbi:MAG: SDR family oxidoreductase [Bryobacteraceae bacterium]